MCLNFWSLFIVTMMSHFRQKRSKPGNEDLFTTMGQESAGEQVSSGWGGGSVPTVTVTLFQTLFAVVKRRMMKNPTWSRFLIATSEKISWSIFEVNVYCFFFPLKILRYRAPLNPRRDGQAITTSQSLIDSDTHTYHEVVDKNWMSNFWMLVS